MLQMNKLIPKDDYFKHTTRRVLSETQKREVCDAANRSIRLLLPKLAETRLPFNSIEELGPALEAFRRAKVFMDRLFTLSKGSIQPRHLYAGRRRMEVSLEAMKIAEETGAEYSVVRDLFLYHMDEFIREQL